MTPHEVIHLCIQLSVVDFLTVMLVWSWRDRDAAQNERDLANMRAGSAEEAAELYHVRYERLKDRLKERRRLRKERGF